MGVKGTVLVTSASGFIGSALCFTRATSDRDHAAGSKSAIIAELMVKAVEEARTRRRRAQAIRRILARRNRRRPVSDKAFRAARDYDVENVSLKVVRTILSYTDYVNRTVWRK